MCANYAPVQRQILRDVFDVEPPAAEWKPEVLPGDAAPVVRTDIEGRRESVLAIFGLVHRSRTLQGSQSFETMNARFECVGDRSSSSGPWHRSQFCLVPATAIYETSYEAGASSKRYRIWLKDEPAFGIAGLWRDWPDGTYSFAMLTVSAYQHPVMKRMQAPGKEKRSVVIVPRTQWADWLSCRDPGLARSFMTLYPADEMAAEPAPRSKEAIV